MKILTLEQWEQMDWQERGTLIAKIAVEDSDGITTPELAMRMWAMANQYGQTKKAIVYLLALSDYALPHRLHGDQVLTFAQALLDVFAQASPDVLCLAVINAFENEMPEMVCQCEQCTCEH